MGENTILITGAAGFIGFHLATRLAADARNRLVLADNLSRGAHDAALKRLCGRKNVRFIKCDLLDPSSYRKLAGPFDYIYHLAAIVGVRNVQEHPDKTLQTNIVATLQLLDWAAEKNERLKRFVFVSTSEAYAGSMRTCRIRVPTDESVSLCLDDLKNPRTTYALSKIVGEAACYNYRRLYGVPVSIVRYHNVYGPRMGCDHVIPQLLSKAAQARREIGVYSPGHTRAFCYVSDAVTATLRIAASPRTEGELFHIGNGCQEIRIIELARMIVRLVNPKLKIRPLADQPGSPRRRCPDTGKIARAVGFKPQVPLQQGLRKTWEWYCPGSMRK